MSQMARSTYLHSIYDPKSYERTLRQVKTRLRCMQKTKKYHFDAIAFTGSSGAAMAYPAAAALGCGLIHVRKNRGHAHLMVEGFLPSKRYIILDDFVDTGATIRRIITEVDKAHKEQARYWYWESPIPPYLSPKLVAVVCYETCREPPLTSNRLTVAERRIGEELLGTTPVITTRPNPINHY